MGIKNINTIRPGVVGVNPSLIFIETDDTAATILSSTYLNKAKRFGYTFNNKQTAIVYTTDQKNVIAQVVVSGADAGLEEQTNPAYISSALASARILVGNASGVATAVAMFGDMTLRNDGEAIIENGAIELSMLDSGISPSHVVKFAGQPTTAGGGAAEAITVTGALATDLAFVQMVDDGTNNVTIVNAVVTADTLTVTFSADPGNDTVINYQLLRAAA